MKTELKRQDKNGVRTASELQQRYKFEDIQKTAVEANEKASTADEQLNQKVDKVTGKGLSTNDFSNSYKNAVNSNTEARHTHDNKTVLDEITETKVSNWDSAKSNTDSTEYDLSNYKVDELTIVRSSCIKKNNRVVVNFVGTISISANTTTDLFNLPSDLSPTDTKDFIVLGQTSDDDGYIGYGNLTSTGVVQVRFAQDITSYIRFNFTSDLD